MARRRWHILREERALTVARALPVRFDVSARDVLPAARKGRLAMQIRQDMWRQLQHVRGFVPAVRVEEDGAHLKVRAGGAVYARTFPKTALEAQIAALLASPAHRDRWLANARLTEENVT